MKLYDNRMSIKERMKIITWRYINQMNIEEIVSAPKVDTIKDHHLETGPKNIIDWTANSVSKTQNSWVDIEQLNRSILFFANTEKKVQSGKKDNLPMIKQVFNVQTILMKNPTRIWPLRRIL